MMSALGAALYHNLSLVEDARPIEAFLDGLFPGGSTLQQFCVPLAPRRERPAIFDRGKLVGRVRSGELFSFLVGSADDVDDADVVRVGFVLAPPTAAAESGLSGYRYRFELAVGSRAQQRLSVDTIVREVVKLADAIDPRAGSIFPAATTAFALSLASGARGGLTEEQDQRVRDVAYAVHELGGKIRGPEWGTFLAQEHIEQLGGLARIEAESQCSIRQLAGGGAYLQVTEKLPEAGDVVFATRLAAVAKFLAPVMK